MLHTRIVTIAIAGDGSWCVIHDSGATFSTGVSNELSQHIKNFFKRQKERRENRNKEIRQYQEKKHIEALTRVLKEEVEREIAKKRKREEAEKDRERERIALINQLTIGARVTVFGYSRNGGDA